MKDVDSALWVAMNKFALCTPGRTGSTYLHMYLNDHPESYCLDEIFHEGHMMLMFPPAPEEELHFKEALGLRYEHPVRHVEVCVECWVQHHFNDVIPKNKGNAVPKVIGYKVVGEDIKLYKTLWNAKTLDEEHKMVPLYQFIILLRRNLTEAAVSAQLADITEEWSWYEGNPQYHSNPTKALKDGTVLDISKMEKLINYHIQFVQAYLPYKDNPRFMHIFYEDLFTIKTTNKVRKFLNLDASLYVEPLVKKQNALKQYQKISNLEEINDTFGKKYGYVGASCPSWWEDFDSGFGQAVD